MYVYWRIQQDLNCLGEMIVFHDPSFHPKISAMGAEKRRRPWRLQRGSPSRT